MSQRSLFRNPHSTFGDLRTHHSAIQNRKSKIRNGSVLTLFFLLAFSSVAQAAAIKAVQRGSVTFTSGANRMAVTLPSAVDPAKTIVWGGLPHGGGRGNTSDPNATRVGFDLESPTVLALERLGSPGNSPVVEWQAVEFLSGVSVQRGLYSMTGTETLANVTLPTAIDPTKSFVCVQGNLGSD